MVKATTESTEGDKLTKVLRPAKRKLTKAERAAEVKELMEKKSQEKLEKFIDQALIAQIAAHSATSTDEAARVLVRANKGDAEAKRIVREARRERHLETRIKQTASKGGLTLEEATELHTSANEGDEAAQAKIKEIRQRNAKQGAADSADSAPAAQAE
mmetsp:Transcript_29506/g.84478  ORF Transcript_29506/g.84478 Transcript_29506/m.84478 type:complete len:158 (-) Transcript_29506:137-610(-)